MIKAIIFDCFGVLVGTGIRPYYDKYLGDDPAKVAQAEAWMRASNKGEIPYEEFVDRLAGLAGQPRADVEVVLDENPRDELLLDYIARELKPHYKIGFLSNASDNWLDELFLPDQIALFDSIVLSYQTGYAKPDPQIYQIALEKLGLPADECLFVDDRPDYAEGARAAGMQIILYKNLRQLQAELGKILS